MRSRLSSLLSVWNELEIHNWQKSKDGKFHSPEKISNELMRESFDELSPKYTMIFTKIASQPNRQKLMLHFLHKKVLKKYVKNGIPISIILSLVPWKSTGRTESVLRFFFSSIDLKYRSPKRLSTILCVPTL